MEDMLRYLDEIAEPTVKDFEEHPMSRRHAFLACVATFHAIDYLAYPNQRSANLRQQFRRRSADFNVVDEVAHAFKHVIAGDRANPNLREREVMARPPALAGVMECGVSRTRSLLARTGAGRSSDRRRPSR